YDGVPGVRVLPAAVQENHLRRLVAPLQTADVTGFDTGDGRERAFMSDLLGVLFQQRELVEANQVIIGDLSHGSTLRTGDIQVRSERTCVSVGYMAPKT